MEDADEHKKELRKMLNLNEVLKIVPIARSTLLRMVKPESISLQPIHISQHRRRLVARTRSSRGRSRWKIHSWSAAEAPAAPA